MAAFHDLLQQIDDPALRERLAREWDAATRHKKFGLVYERHLPELLPLYNASPRRGDLVVKRGGTLTEVWRVRKIEGETAVLSRPRQTGERSPCERLTLPLDELLIVKQFGEPIFPSLTPVDAVRNGPDNAPWHVLIEADNYHALQMLEYLYAGRVDCIYIDPPYNTGAKDWKYNNNYVDANDSWRHSKWLSFMEKRLRLAKRLLKPETGVLIVTIDEHEVHHLGVLLEECFSDTQRQMVSIVINPKGVTQGRLSRVEEYAVFCFKKNAEVFSLSDDLLSREEGPSRSPRWKGLLRSGAEARRQDREKMFFPVLIDKKRGAVVKAGDVLPIGEEPRLDEPVQGYAAAWPIRKDGTLGRWGVGRETLNKLIEAGFVSAGRYDKVRRTWGISYLSEKARQQIEAGSIEIVEYDENRNSVVVEYVEARRRQIKTVWHRSLHDAGAYGSDLLRSILGRASSFTFPKSLYSTKDAIAAVVQNNSKAIVLDFFAGSGTTLNSVNLINARDGGQRQCILVTNNEVAEGDARTLQEDGFEPGDDAWEALGICRSVTWPRSKLTLLGRRDDGSPLTGDYFIGRTVEREKPRRFRHLAFATPDEFRLPEGLDDKTRVKVAKEIVKKQKALVNLIDGLPQNAVTEGCRFIAREDDKAAVLFDPEAAEDWLTALDEQDQITDFFIVAASDKQFYAIKQQVEELLGPQLVQEADKRPIAEGFAANLAYFKLDFLDKDRVEVGAAFQEILPLLWLKAGAIGPRPELPSGPLPDWFAPDGATFAVLLHEARIKGFLWGEWFARRSHDGSSAGTN